VIDFFHVKSGVVVNKYDLNVAMTEKIQLLAHEHRCDFLGAIPYDNSITEAQMKKLSIVEYKEAPLTKSIKEIWSKLEGLLRIV